MKSKNIFSHIVFIGILIVTSFEVKAQNSFTIQLIDLDTHEAILGASFQYGKQHGITGESGTIELVFSEGLDLELSHISYGRWKFNSKEVMEAIESGIIFRSKSIIDILPVTILGVRNQNNTSESMSIDDEGLISHDGGSLLSKTPEVAGIRKSGSYGFDPVLRGFKQEQLKILINGCQSSIAACPNRMDPPTSQVSPNMIDYIQISKGPHSLRFGNGLGGTINFVSAKPSFSMKPDLFGRVTGGYESNGNIYRTEGMIGVKGKKYNLGLFGSWSQGFDYSDGEGEKVPAQFKRGSAGLNMAFKIAQKQTLTFSLTHNFANDVDFPALPMDLRKDDTWMLNVGHQIYFSQKKLQSWKTTIYGTHVNHLMNNFLKEIKPRMVNAETEAKTISAGGRTEGNWNFNENYLFAGLDYRYENADGIRTREFVMGPNDGKLFTDNAWQQGSINNYGLFAEYQLKFKLWMFVFSGRLGFNQSKSNDPALEFVEFQGDSVVFQVNPGLSLGVIKSFNNGFKTGIWFGHAQRSASLTERYINYFSVGQDAYEMLGNPMLDPEENNQIDLTFSYESSKTNLDLNLFSSFMHNFISSEIVDSIPTKLPTSPGVRVYKNIDRAFLAGFEFSWAQKLAFGMQHQLAFAFTYGQNTSNAEPLPEIAPLDFRYSLMGSYIKDKLKPKINFRYVMKQDRIAESFGETASPGFFLIDFDLSYRISKSVKVTGGVYNLLNNNYYEHLNRPVKGGIGPIYAPGRSYLITISVDFM